MHFRLKKLLVRSALALLHGLVVVKRQLVFVFRNAVRAGNGFIRLLGGRHVLILIARLVGGSTGRPSLRSSTIGFLLVLTLSIVLYRVIAIDARTGADIPPAAGETVEGILEEYTGIGGPDLSMLGALEVIPSLPGALESTRGALAITGEGNAIAAAASPITQLENRLRTEPETYIVQEGDTTGAIAARFGISTNTILWENKLTARSLIRPGQTLTILPTSGLSHTVKRGETLASIAKRYKVETSEVLNFNEIEEGATIAVGTKLIIPEGTPPVTVIARAPTPRAPTTPPPSGMIPTGDGMMRPTSGYTITQYYSYRHSGIDLGTKTGTPIVASDDGVVIRSGWATGYGNMVMIDHGNGLVTRYGHASKLYAEKGDSVKKGDTIALIGSTGRSTGPHLHFEVIQNGRFVDPRTYVKF